MHGPRIKGPRSVNRFDPVTGNIRAPLIADDEQAVDRAVRRARLAFDEGPFPRSSRSERSGMLRTLLAHMEKRREDLVATISREIGAPVDFARAQQVEAAFGHIKAIIDALDANENDIVFVPGEPHHRVRYEPVGVAVLITPWNWPLNQVVLKVAAALAAGCTIVLKPSELAHDTALLFAECVSECGLPDGVFNLVAGDGTTGESLVHHPLVDIISFTGSTAVGRSIAATAGLDLKRTILELGGKSPNLIFADCDLEKAIRQGVAHCFRNSGQSCNAASLMLVERDIYKDAVDLARRAAETYRPGDPTRPGSHLGPLVSESQFNRVQAFIDSGVYENARLVTGGSGRPDGFSEGYFVKPTIFADARPDMAIFREEIFGPVLTIASFDNEAEAITLANESPYGLAAYVQTNDPVRADRIAQQLRAGMVQVNGSSRAPGTAFGGMKASGIGREAGLFGIRSFQETKSISGAHKS
ncbi:MAG: aldehyde dehydrogenase family protein [Pseudomonadota bacterium]